MPTPRHAPPTPVKAIAKRQSMPPSHVRAGIGLMLLGIFLFAVNDVMGKWLVATYSVGQVLLLRSAAALLLLAPFVLRHGVARILAAPRPGLQLLRVAFGTLEVAAFYWAVTALPLVDVMTFYLAAPILVAVLAPFLLGERLDRGQWTAVLAGFAGVLIILQPSAATLSGPAIIALGGSALFAGLILSTRFLRGTSGLSLITWQTAGALAFGLIAAPFAWVPPTTLDFALLSLLGVVAMLAHMAVTRALQLAPAAVVSPYQYTLILWALVFGWFVFGDWPSPAMGIGGAIVVGSGLYLLRREASAPPPSPATPVATPLPRAPDPETPRP